MLNWNDIFSGLGFVLAGFAYASVSFTLISYCPFWVTAIMFIFTVAIDWLLSSFLPTKWIVATAFASQMATLGFLGNVLPGDEMLVATFWWLATLMVAIVSHYTTFLQATILLFLGICTVFFTASIYLFLIGFGDLWGGKNLFEGSATERLPLFNQRVEIRTDHPKQLYLNGKTGRLKQINFYHVIVQLDSGEEESIWWQDVKADPVLKSQ